VSELRTAEPRFRAYIDAAANFAGLPHFSYRDHEFSPGELLEGQILAESNGDRMARRYESHQDRAARTDAPRDPDTHDQDDGDLEDDASYGLLQVMGFNARVLCGCRPGTPMKFGWLFLPQTNISLGLRILLAEMAAVYRVHPHEAESERLVRALCRYNGGPTGDAWIMETHDFRLRKYVDHVAANALRAQESRRLMGWRH
jgi:hypothetical protein